MKPEMFFDNLVWMNSKEAAFYIRVSVGQLRNLVSERKIPHHHFGGRLRFLKTDLDTLMKSTT